MQSRTRAPAHHPIRFSPAHPADLHTTLLMDWHNARNKHSSISGVLGASGGPAHNVAVSAGYLPQVPGSMPPPPHRPMNIWPVDRDSPLNGVCRGSYFASQYPLYCADWASYGDSEFVALSSFREGYQNKLQVAHGCQLQQYPEEVVPEKAVDGLGNVVPAAGGVEFQFSAAAETLVDYPVTHLQWDPRGTDRLATSSEVLRLYKFDCQNLGAGGLVQTHLLANNSTSNLSAGSEAYDINTFPPVTSFDWNKCDPSTIITLSVDTTCTVWDLSRSRTLGRNMDTAHVKTQLIAHDLEVFDVKFIHGSTNVFASVSNDGSMRVFDLRSLEHSTIIYELCSISPPDSKPSHYNLYALLKLLASNIDEHHLATVGVNLNQVLIIDMRMPGVPVITLDGLFDGASSSAINSIEWHPSCNMLATGGDDCQALLWNCSLGGTQRTSKDGHPVIDLPVLAYSDEMEINTVCWKKGSDDWLGVVCGKGFQAISMH